MVCQPRYDDIQLPPVMYCVCMHVRLRNASIHPCRARVTVDRTLWPLYPRIGLLSRFTPRQQPATDESSRPQDPDPARGPDKMYHLAKGLYRLATSKEGKRIGQSLSPDRPLGLAPLNTSTMRQNTRSSSSGSTTRAKPPSTNRSKPSSCPTAPPRNSRRSRRSARTCRPSRSPTCTSSCGTWAGS